MNTLSAVSKNRGLNCPPKWMVKIMENPHKNGWFWGGPPLFSETSKYLCGFCRVVWMLWCGSHYLFFAAGLSIYVSSSPFSTAEVPEARGGPESGSNVTVPLECQSLPLRRVEFWVLAWRSGCNLIAQRDQASLAAHRTWYFICCYLKIMVAGNLETVISVCF